MPETNDLILKSGHYEDWESLYECFWSREEPFTYLFQRPCPTPEAAQKKTQAYADMHREVKTEFFVFQKESSKAIGIAGLKQMAPGLFTITDIALGPDFCHRGYGKQILQALTELAQELGAQTLLFNCFQENTASRRLAESCGFRYTHTEEAELRKNGRVVMLQYFELSIVGNGCIRS